MDVGLEDTNPRIQMPRPSHDDTQPRVSLSDVYRQDTQPRVVLEAQALATEEEVSQGGKYGSGRVAPPRDVDGHSRGRPRVRRPPSEGGGRHRPEGRGAEAATPAGEAAPPAVAQ